MNITVPTTKDIAVDAIKVIIPFDGDDEIPADFFGREGETITLVLDLDTAKVRDWPGGEAKLDVKVRDSGVYCLMSGTEIIAKREDYVPRCIPQDFGDYVRFEIGDDGALKGWKPDRIKVRDSFFRSSDD